MLPLGTTTLVADNLFFYMQMGPDGFAAMADDLHELPLTYLWVARLASQSKFPGEEAMFRSDKIQSLLERDEVAGTAEVTSWPSLAAGDRRLLEGIAAAEAGARYPTATRVAPRRRASPRSRPQASTPTTRR